MSYDLFLVIIKVRLDMMDRWISKGEPLGEVDGVTLGHALDRHHIRVSQA